MKLLIGIPSYDSRMETRTAVSLANLLPALQAAGIKYGLCIVAGDAMVTRARNEVVGRFLQSPADALLCLDADMEFSPEDVLTMHGAARGVVVGDYPKRVPGGSGVARLDVTKADLVENADGSVTLSWSGPLIEIAAVGAGFMLLRRDVVERLVARAPAYVTPGGLRHDVFACGVRDGAFETEDYAFCRRLREAGETIWMDTRVKLGHCAGGVVYRLPEDHRYEVRFLTAQAYETALRQLATG